MKIYQFDENGYFTGAVLEISEDQGASAGWTRSVLPELSNGEFAVFNGRWSVTTNPPPDNAQVTPAYVTMRQARLALHAHGKLTAVQESINLLPDPPKTEAQIEWDYASIVERASPFVAMLTPAIGMTDAEMDELFREASKL